MIDSIHITKIIRLINDYKACEEYSQDITDRLITAREMIGRLVSERDEYKEITIQLDDALKDMTARKEDLEKKLKRTRKIGIWASIGSFIGGILFFVLI